MAIFPLHPKVSAAPKNALMKNAAWHSAMMQAFHVGPKNVLVVRQHFGSSREVREKSASGLLEAEGPWEAPLVRRAFHGTRVTPAADNTGIISEESGTEKQPEELILQAAKIQSVSEQKKPVTAVSQAEHPCYPLLSRRLRIVVIRNGLFLRFKDHTEFTQTDQAEEAEHNPGECISSAVGDIKNIPANQAQGKQK